MSLEKALGSIIIFPNFCLCLAVWICLNQSPENMVLEVLLQMGAKDFTVPRRGVPVLSFLFPIGVVWPSHTEGRSPSPSSLPDSPVRPSLPPYKQATVQPPGSISGSPAVPGHDQPQLFLRGDVILELLSLCVKILLFQNRLEEYSGAKGLGDVYREAPWSREAEQRDNCLRS